MSEYERLRLANIQRNASMLCELGLGPAATPLRPTHEPPVVPAAPQKQHSTPVPLRRSSRARSGAEGGPGSSEADGITTRSRRLIPRRHSEEFKTPPQRFFAYWASY